VRYSVDTSALLDGWRRYYPPDVIPGLWSGLDALIVDGSLRATEAVVTGERRRTKSADRPNIPDVCDALDIPCLTLLDLMRAEGWRFER
jgi:Domain of unknown function (DUF4411)